MTKVKLNRYDYILFLMALFMLVVYIYLQPQLFPNATLRIKLTETEISHRANQILYELGYDGSIFTQQLVLRQDLEQIRYLQKQFGLKRANEIIVENKIPVYYWRINFKEKTAPKKVIKFSHDSEEEARSAIKQAPSDTISLSLTLEGQLISLEVQLGKKDQIDTLSYEQALSLAVSLLKKSRPDDFQSYRLISSKNENQKSWLEYDFQWENSKPIYDEKVTTIIGVYGQHIKKYQVTFTPPRDVVTSPPRSELRSIPSILSFIAIFIIFIVLLIKKLRRDEIELKSNVVLSVIISIAWIWILINNLERSGEGLIVAILIPILVTCPFIFISFLIVSSISESGAREVWEEKLFTYDTLRTRTILFPQFSLAIWRGLALAFIAVGTLSILLKISSAYFHFYMNFENNNLTEKISFVPILFVIASGLMYTGFYEFIFRLFLVTALRTKFQNWISIVILGSLASIFSFGGYSNLNLSSYPLNLIINFFIASIFVAFFLKWDFMTVWWGAIVYYFLRELYPLTFYDKGFFMWNGISMWLLFALFFILAIIGYRKRVAIQALQKYVPAYVTRRAERDRIQRELEIARRVQLSFLPRQKPKLTGIDVASICIPAMEVGGDYYDFIELDDHRLGVVIGDVSGKGISAAFHMTLTKGLLKSQAKSGLSPRQVMINLNELFYENVERGTFISMIYGIFDLQTYTFTFARAGHNPLILRKGENEQVEVLCPRGLALGLEKGVMFQRIIEEHTIGIQSNDIFIFYTDGFSEAMNNEMQEFGEDRLYRMMKESIFSSAEALINKCKYEVVNFVGDAPQHDDMTMLVVKIL